MILVIAQYFLTIRESAEEDGKGSRGIGERRAGARRPAAEIPSVVGRGSLITVAAHVLALRVRVRTVYIAFFDFAHSTGHTTCGPIMHAIMRPGEAEKTTLSGPGTCRCTAG